MQVGLVPRLDALRPVIKARWTERLWAEPVGLAPAETAFVTPGMLAFMVDDTLRRLSASLSEFATIKRPPRPLKRCGAGGARCRCGLRLLLTYYLAGARALREVLPEKFGPARVAVLQRFTRLAHDEIATLCGGCRHCGGTQCCLPSPSPPSSGLIVATEPAPTPIVLDA